MGSCENTALVNVPLPEVAATEQHLCSEAMENLVPEQGDCLVVHSNGDCAVESGEYESTGCERSRNICCTDVVKGDDENMVGYGLKELMGDECGGSMVCLKESKNDNVNRSCLDESIGDICGQSVACLVNQGECVNDSSSMELKGGSYDDRVVCLEENQGESVADSCLKEMMANRCRNSAVYSNENLDESIDGSFSEELMSDKCGDTTISSNENRGANIDDTDLKELIGDKYGNSLECMNAYLSQNVDVSGSKEMMGDRSGDGAACLNNDQGENADGSGAEELIDSGDKTSYSSENQFQIGNLSGSKELMVDGVGDHVVCLNENQGNIDVEDSETDHLCLKNKVTSGEDSPTAIDRSLGLSQDENISISGGMEISMNFLDKMKGNDEIAIGLTVKESMNELGDACLSENQGKVDHFNSEKDASLEAELTLKPKTVTLLGNFVEQDKHKADDSASESTLHGIIEEFCDQKSSVKSCKLALESVTISGFRSDCHHQTDMEDTNNVRDPILDGKSSASSMIESDMCCPISASFCAQKPSSFHRTGYSVISGDILNLKDDPSSSDLSLESFTKPMETKSKDDICIELSASESCLSTLEMLHGTQSLGTGLNAQIDDKNVSCPVGDNVAEVSERTVVAAGKKTETSSKIITAENNACNLKGDPFELGAKDVCAVNSSSSSIDCSGQREAEQKDAIKADCVSETKHHPFTSSSSQRGSRRSKSSRKNSAKKVARNCRKTKLSKTQESFEFIFKVSRRKRSYSSKPARSLVWGLFSNIQQLLDQHRDPGCNEEQKKEPPEAGGGQPCERRSKNRAGKSKKGSRGVSSTSTSCLRLKIKVGKEVPSNINTVVAEAVKLPVAVNTSFSNYGKETSLQCPKLSDIVEDKVGEQGYERLFQSDESLEKVNTCSDAPIMDLKLENKIVGSVRNFEKPTEDAADDYIVSPSDVVADGGEAVEIKYMDPGTSPDSEVINLIPDTQVGSTQQEVSPNTVLDTSGVHASSAVVKSSKSSKRGKKDNHKSPCAARRKSKSSKNSKRRQKSNNNEVCSSDVPALSTEANTSGETGLGVSEEVMKVVVDVEAKACCPDDPDIKHAKSSSSSKGKQNQCSKSSKSQGLSKGKSRVSNSARSKKGNARSKRANNMKSVRKGKVKEKGSDEEAVAKGERDSETGNHISADTENSNTGNIIASADMLNTNLASAGAMEQYAQPDNAWVRCDDCYKWRRIPVALVQSVDNASHWICGDNVEKAFADCSIPQEMSNADINAELGYSDAEDDGCDGFNYKELEKGFENKCVTVSPTSHFWRIVSNQFLHRCRKTQTIDEIMVCYCKPPPDGKLGCGDACLNRLLNIECVKGTCPCGDLCSNQQFQKRKYPKMKWDKCGKKGFGLRILENISAGQFLIEYVGEVLDMQAYKARQKEYASRGQRHFYFMTLNGSEVIDACVKGNYGRFINHSCDPNCRTEKWMVNGEICIGLFALRDIKKGEEVTFDYNYVRVFGAAAKKCHCGSPNCRGYIGGDPLSAEVTVHDDSDEEYPEPLMLEEGENWKGSDNIISRSCSFDDGEIKSVESAITDGEIKLENILEPEDYGKRAASSMSQLNCSVETENFRGNFPSSIQSEEPVPVLCEAAAAIQSDNSAEKKASIQKLDTSPIIVDNKLPSEIADGNKKSKFDSAEDKQIVPKSRPLMKTSRSSGSVKEKISSNSLNGNKVHITSNKSQVPSVKPKKLLDNSSNCRFEAVEEKLNELLDSDGGITKRKDASKGYLKLLLLTATSGDGGSGEAIQSNRDLSMILDALLKTKSRVVLTDIINKNGLQMLHNIMKKYRSDFKKIPILRKLLKVLDHLASREILTLEHINGGPPCAGRESFRESMLSLTEHEDKQVHQIARNFRDRWIPKPVRKHGYREKDEGRKDFHRGLDCNRVSTSLNHLHDQAIRPAEAVSSAIHSVDTAAHEGCSLSSTSVCQISGTKIRKRKSRWDQPAEEKVVSHSPKKLEYSSLSIVVDSAADQESMSRGDKKCQDHVCKGKAINVDNGRQNSNEDVPPGFSSLISSTAPCNTDSPEAKFCQLKCPDVILAHPQKKFISRLPVSYGIPLPIVHQFGSPLGECAESWVIAPGMPFHPFPPLPPYPRDQRETPVACTANSIGIKKDAEGQQVRHRSPASCQDESISSTTGGSQPDMDIPATNILQTYKRTRESNDLGKKYFRQQKRKVVWHKSECMDGGTCHIGVGNVKSEIRNFNSSDDITCRDEKRSQ